MRDADCSRRTFLGVAGGLVAGPTLAANAAVREAPVVPVPRAPRSIKKAVKLGMVSGSGTPTEKFALLKRLGFDGVEPARPSDIPLASLIEARDSTGLAVHGVVNSEHWRSPLSDPDAAVRTRGRDALMQAIDDCAALGGTTVLLVPGRVTRDVSYADAYLRSREEIQKTLQYAADRGVRIALENVWNQFLLSPLEAAAYVDSFECPWIGWYFDVGNIVNYGWPQHWIETLGPRIFKLDIKEYSREKRDAEGLWKGFNVELLEGDCDWPRVMSALDAIGFTGWATAEIAGGDETRLRDIAARMDRILVS